MIKSMTGYGKAEALVEGRQLQVEIKSVNHRDLDLSLRLPSFVLPLETEIRGKISRKFFRGRVDVSIRIDKTNGQENSARYELNQPAIRNFSDLLTQMKQELKLSDELTLPMIAGCKDAFIASEQVEDVAALRGKLEESMDMAIKSVLAMREKEGAALGADLKARIDSIRILLGDIGSRAPAVAVESQKRLTARVNELSASLEIDECRLVQEIAIMAARSDITEELVRFNSHISQIEKLLQYGDTIGRKVDFWIQEMGREINAVGSKSSDAVISRHVVEIKSELGKLKEQVQNIE